MAIQIKSFNQILGDMIRKIIAETPLNDINAGSVLLTLLEACAANDFENNAAILNVLELLNIDAVKNNDLDSKAADYGLTRKPAKKSSGQVTVYNRNITKRSTGLYVIKPAPIAGQTVIYVNNTSGWASTGLLYIGRGTQSFEGPISYTSITTFPTYSAITLASALQRDHLISESIIDAQGQPDRIIAAGTIVKIPANNQNPEIPYLTLRDVVIPAGEDQVKNVDIIAISPGSQGNVPINTIAQFNAAPFTGAGVSNTSALSDGEDVETDTQLRNRLKSYSITLARGTSPSILSAVIGVSDPDDSKQVSSAVLTEPVKIGDPSIMYIDDGSGFQPSYAGQSVDKMLASAEGGEEFLQLANYPVPRPQVINVAEGPFTLTDGSFLRVTVDGSEETIFFSASDFLNISSATIAEIIIAINNGSKSFKARFANNSASILLYPVAHDAETIQVSPIKASDNILLYANSILKFPTNEFSYISLYQNSNRLREKSRNASLETVAFATWNITNSGNLIIEVDGTPAQDRNFSINDFPGQSSFTSLSINDWVDAFNNKFAGVTTFATPGQTVILQSNKVGSKSSLIVSGGTLFNSLFSNVPVSSTGQSAQFELNRQTGNLRILNDIAIGDSISAGVEDAKGFITSTITNSGNYNLSVDAHGRPAEAVLVLDSNECTQRSIPLLVGSNITVSDQGNNVMRIMSSTVTAFANLLPGDFIYITKRTSGWLSSNNCGLFKIVSKGSHTDAGVNSFVQVLNDNITSESFNVADSQDIKAFATDGYPQIWRGSYLINPPVASLTDIVASLSKDVVGVKASVFKSNSVKITSTTENSGSIAVPVTNGLTSTLFAETPEAQTGNASHVASRVSNKSLLSFFKSSTPTSTNIWLDRQVYADVKGSISADAGHDVTPFSGAYSETVQCSGVLNASKVAFNDIISFTKGNNKGQLRAIKALVATDQAGTQQSTPRTELDHILGDEIQILKSLSFSSDDSVVAIIDKDSVTKTVDVKMARTGRVNSGSGPNTFLPTTTEFSANDYDNEPNIDFNNLIVWGTSTNNTDFSDYAVWTRSRNWYASGGVASSSGKMLVRAQQYGPNGDRLRFNIKYPVSPNQNSTTSFLNTPSFSTYSYLFGSGAAKATAIPTLATISVQGPYPDDSTNFPNGTISSGSYFDYTFSTGSLASVVVGDVLSIGDNSGISTFNRGQFRVMNKSANTVRVFNPSASITAAGTPEVDTVTTVADIVGTPTNYQVTAVADVSGSLNGTYFIVYDSAGSVAVWIDIDNSGTPEPSHGANRSIKIATISTDDTAATVATKIYNRLVLDSAFNTTAVGANIYIDNAQNGVRSNASAGTSGFTVGTTAGTNNMSVDGKYFLVYDDAGSVAVWYALNDGATQEPFHGADRSIRIGSVNSGDSAATVAAATAGALNADLKFSAGASSSVITVTNSFLDNTADADAGTSGFSVSSVDGTLGTAEIITNTNVLWFFPLTGTTVTQIINTVNDGDILLCAAVSGGGAVIDRSTEEEDYAYVSNATALAYGHNPTDPLLRGYIGLYDGQNWVKSFQNVNPNFVFKMPFILNDVAPSVYGMNTAPNSDVLDTGELFKLIPTTVKNVYHHLTQKALSQLPIISSLDITNASKNVQVKSNSLGSEGAIEIVGGQANGAQAYIIGESEISTDTNGNTLLMKVPAFPDTFNVGDMIRIDNDSGVKRLSRLIASDSINVVIPSSGIVEYNFNPKTTSISSGTTFAIADVSASYGRPTGFVWRWTHGGGASLSLVQPGDVLTAFGALPGWDQGNKARESGDVNISGLPIIAVNDSSNYIDVINPYGKAMSSTAVGASSTVQICPTPIIRWNLNHSARINIVSISRTSNIITVTCAKPHMMNSGDSVDIADSGLLADGTYAPVTVTSQTVFTFTSAGSNFSEGTVGANLIKTSNTLTRYRIEKLGINGLTRISRHDGDSPRFVDCGVALDDYLTINGSTFKSNNNGRFRVLAVDNDSIIYINDQATDELNTVKQFNKNGLLSSWTSNSNIVTGVAGTFKDVAVGQWVKKLEDADTYYRQVVSLNAAAASATQIVLGANYAGTTDATFGVAYDQLNDHNSGIMLNAADDIAVYEGDAVVTGDTLFVQNLVNTNWFNQNNIGSFDIIQYGTNGTTYKPFLRINNNAGVAESNRLMSVDPSAFYIVENLVDKFYSMRQVTHSVLDDLNTERRSIYVTPHSRSYKFSDANATKITHLGKLGYSTDVVTGIDGYLYYTGLLRRVQRIVDGFEPDPENFPGRRAIGGAVEILPPLIKQIVLTINVTTDEGVNLGDISNNVKSVIINYIEGLGVGQDVILSKIIAAVTQIKGVGAVTFTNPLPSTERINVASNEKVIISPDNIGIA